MFPEASLSVRLLWPFMRVVGHYPGALELLEAHGVQLGDLANPDTRIAHRTVMHLLRDAVRARGDATLGLKAAESFGPADLGVLEFATGTCATLREAVKAAADYTRLLNSAAFIEFEERGDVATFRFHIIDGVVQAPAANDFEVAVYHLIAKRYLGDGYEAPLEVHLAHREPTSEREYVRVFGSLPRMSMPHNAIVFRRALLERSMPNANTGQHRLFEQHIQTLLERQRRCEGWTAHVRALLVANLATRQMPQHALAKALGVSASTLRRHLNEEGTTYAQLLGDVRRELAERYLTDTTLSVNEIAFLLGYSHTTAFFKAFRRWFEGMTPNDLRAQLRSASKLQHRSRR